MAGDTDRTANRPLAGDTTARLQRLGRYEIVGVLGKGAMGVVYRGRDPKIGRDVALKMIRTDSARFSAEKSELVQRFGREARAAGKIAHPNIVTIYDFDEVEGVSYIAMELLEGIGLDQLVRERGRLAAGEAIAALVQISDALHYLHQHGIVHRDVKPANIMVLEGGIAKLMDFGIAKDLSADITQPGAVLGTPQYMSPEQFTARPIDARSDLFSLGVVLYEVVTGEKPFAAETISTLMQKIVHADPAEPRARNPAISAHLNAVILKALRKDPSERYQTAKEFEEALRHLIELEKREDDEEDAVGGPAAPAAGIQSQAGPRETMTAEPEPAGGSPPSVTPAGAAMRRKKTVMVPVIGDESSLPMPSLSREESKPPARPPVEEKGSTSGGTAADEEGDVTLREGAARPPSTPIYDAPIQRPAWMRAPDREASRAFPVLFVGAIAVVLVASVIVTALLLRDHREAESREAEAGRGAISLTPEAAAPAPKQVLLSVGSQWVGGRLIVDGGDPLRIGSTPFSVRLAPGIHQLRLRNEGFEDAVVAGFEIPAGEAGSIVDLTHVKPRPKPARSR